jgi:tRNA-specific 2-thiouridylase
VSVSDEHKKGKVLAATSGGVDSSVAAAILVEQGYDVIGVTMKLFCFSHFENLAVESSCCSLDSSRTASSVAESLDIPHVVLDMEQIFREEVLRDFFTEYSKGRTPNPCILCNSRMKFYHLLNRGEKLGASYLATGHYARIETTHEPAGITHHLLKAEDELKDQSYFLWEIKQDILSKTLFPLGELNKTKVRDIARAEGLEVADRPESQDFCFLSPDEIWNTGWSDTVLNDLGFEPTSMVPGPIVNKTGEQIGTHRGIAYYTTGQRRGLGIALGRPAYVVKIDPGSNTLVVGFEEDLYTDQFTVSRVNWVSGRIPEQELTLSIKVRSRSAPAIGTVTPTGENTAYVHLQEPKKAVTPGQSAVWYDGPALIGGGVID